MADGITYYRDIDEGVVAGVYAHVGDLWLFRLNGSGDRADWEFLVPSSPDEGSVHQKIFRQRKVDRLTAEEIARLPPLPPVPPGPFAARETHYLPERPLAGSAFPATAERVKAQPGGSLAVVIVLFEDTYESMFGDGRFLYFRGVFLSEPEARDYIERNPQAWMAFHLATLEVVLEAGVFGFPRFKHGQYEEFRPEQAIWALETRLRGEA